MAFPYDLQRLRQMQMWGGSPSNYSSDDYSSDGDIAPVYSRQTFPDVGTLPMGQSSRLDDIANASTSGYQPQSMEDMWNQLNKIYTPSTTATDRLNQLLSAYPNRQDYKPNFGRTLAASLSGFRSKDPMGTMDKILNEPYNEQVADWKNKADAFEKAAQYENTANINERTLAGNILTAETAAARQAEASRIADEKNRITEAKNQAAADTAKTRAAAYAAKNNGWDVDMKGPNVIAVNPVTGERKVLGPTGHLSDEDAINLKGGYQVKAAEIRGRTAEDVANIREGEYVRVGDAIYRLAGGKLIPTTVEGGGELPAGVKPVKLGTEPQAKNVTAAQRKENEYVRARELATDPELGKYITLTPDEGTWEVDLPGLDWMASEKDKAKGKEIQDYIEGRTDVKPGTAPPVKPTTAPTKPAVTKQPIATKQPTATKPVTEEQRAGQKQSAIQFLQQHGQAVTERNIQLAIDRGYVR